jgi:CHAT domain-containing protein
MSPDSYLDFDLLIEADGPNYKATVIDSPAGQSDNSFTLPFSEKDLEILVLQVFRLTSRRSVRAIASPEMRDVRSFGGHLFESLFSGPVSTCLLRSMDEADRTQSGLRVRLHLGDAPSLANVPWEFLYDSSSDGFLCLSDQTPVVRYIDLPQRVEPLAASPPLRMLCLISSPAGYPPLDVEHEWAKLSEALAPTVKEGRLLLERVDTPSLEALQRKLRRNQYHVLHFVGHGAFDEQAQDGVLLFEDLEGKGHPVSGESLGVLLHDHESLRLVVLNACEGARTSSTDPFAGTAQSLVRKGIPAVIAMQFEISDVAAITLANEFYSAVADGYPVDAALSEARKAIFTRVNAVEWATPVLYMRSPDGRIFEIEDRAERLEARTLRHEEPLPPVPTPESGPVAVAEPVAPEPETQPVAAERLTHPIPPPPRIEPVAPGRPQAAGPVGRPAMGGLLSNRKVVIPVAIGAVLLLLIGIGALINNNSPSPGPGPSGTSGASQTTSPPSAPKLADLAFIPVSDVQRGPSGQMLRVAEGTDGSFGAVGRDGSRGAIWGSPDGRQWTQIPMPPATSNTASQQVQGILQRGPLLVAAGYEVSTSREEYAAVWTSTNEGASWQAWDQPALHGFGPTRINRLALDGDFLIAVGRSGDNAVLWSSQDGSVWARDGTGDFTADPGQRLALRDALEGTNHVVAVGEDSVLGAAAWYRVKPSGLWTRARVKGAHKGQSLISVAGGPERFVAVGYDTVNGDDDAAAWTSTNGTSWTRASQRALHRAGDQRMRGVAYVRDLGFVAVGIDGTDAAVWTSEDGRVWIRSEKALTDTGSRQMTGIVATATKLIVVGIEDGAAAVWRADLPTG